MKLLSLIGLLITLTTAVNAQQVVTLTAAPWDGTNYTETELTIEADQAVDILGITPAATPGSLVVIKRGNDTLQFFDNSYFRPNEQGYTVSRRFGGPLTIELRNYSTSPASCTVEISPGQYPPGKSAVIGERDGPMKCTLEESTDLVNWTQSTSGATHTLTNANVKKFFRIKLEQDVGP